MGCMKDFPGLFNIQVSSEHRSYLWFLKDKKNIPVTLWYSEPVNQPANLWVSVTDRIALCLHAVQQCSRKIIQRNRSDVSDDYAISQTKTAANTEVTFCSTLHKRISLWPVSGWLSYYPWKKTTKPEEMDCKWHNIYLYQILWDRPESTVVLNLWD